MASIVLGDDQRMRLARQADPYHFEGRKSVMEGGSRLTPGDIASIASMAMTGADALSPLMGGVKDTMGGPLGGMLPPPAPPPPPPPPPTTPPTPPPTTPPTPPAPPAPDWASLASMASTSIGNQPPSAPVVSANRPIDVFGDVLNFDVPSAEGGWNVQPPKLPERPNAPAIGPAAPQPDFPPIMDWKQPAMQMPGGAQAQATPQGAAPFAQPQLSAQASAAPSGPDASSGAGASAGSHGSRVVKLLDAPARRGVGTVQPDGAAGAAAQQLIDRAEQQYAPQRPVNYAEQFGTPATTPAQNTPPQQPAAAPQQQPSMQTLFISPNASLPELVRARERAMYGTPEDREVFFNAVMQSDFSDAPSTGIIDRLSGNHITRARQQLLSGIEETAAKARAQGASSAAEMARWAAEFGLKRDIEKRKTKEGERTYKANQRWRKFEMTRAQFADNLAANRDNREQLQSMLKGVEAQLKMPYITEREKVEIQGRRADIVRALSGAQASEASAKRSQFAILPEGQRVSVNTGNQDFSLFRDTSKEATQNNAIISKAANVLQRPNVTWGDVIREIPDLQKAVGADLNAKVTQQEAAEIIRAKIRDQARVLQNLDLFTRPDMKGRFRKPVLAPETEQALRALGIELTAEERAVLGLTAGGL